MLKDWDLIATLEEERNVDVQKQLHWPTLIAVVTTWMQRVTLNWALSAAMKIESDERLFLIFPQKWTNKWLQRWG